MQEVRDAKGDVVSEPRRAVDLFAAHWHALAEENVIDESKTRGFLRGFLTWYMRKISSFRVVLTYEEFAESIRQLLDSACGPDGIPYSA